MAVQSLVLCRDPETLNSLRPLLDRLGFGTQVCGSPESAARMLRRRHFDTVIVECDYEANGLALLRTVRRTPANIDAITVGILEDSRLMEEALDMGANFVLGKPVPLEDARRILQTAQSMMTGVVRRFLRLPVGVLTYASVQGLEEKAMMLDLGEGGMSLQALERLPVGRNVRVQFELPGTWISIEARGEVVWSDASGRIGIHFLEIADRQRWQLKDWVRNSVAPAWRGLDGDRRRFGLPPPQPGLGAGALGEAVDVGVVLASSGVFALLLTQVLDWTPRGLSAAVFGGAVLLSFWAMYQYLFFLHAVKTPGAVVARWALQPRQNTPETENERVAEA